MDTTYAINNLVTKKQMLLAEIEEIDKSIEVLNGNENSIRPKRTRYEKLKSALEEERRRKEAKLGRKLPEISALVAPTQFLNNLPLKKKIAYCLKLKGPSTAKEVTDLLIELEPLKKEKVAYNDYKKKIRDRLNDLASDQQILRNKNIAKSDKHSYWLLPDKTC